MECSRASSNQSSLKLSSTVTSDIGSTISDHNEKHPSIESRVCLVGSAANNENLKKKLKDLNIPHLSSEDGKEYVNENELYFETIFILEDFEGSLFENLKRTDNRILGSPVVYSVAATNEPLPYNSRPLFCTCMQGLNLCFTNFKTKDHVSHLVTLCHYMGASIRKDMSAKIDYLITNILHGPKYRKAVSLGTPVMKEEWIHRCWSARKRSDMYQATDDEFLTPCKSKPFEGCIISFLGFSEGEKQHMEEQAKEQGGSVAEVGDVGCTHLVVDENTVKSLPFKPEGKLYIIVQEWFWGSIQIEAKAAESMYIFDLVEYPKMLTRSATTSSLLGTPKWRGSTANFLGRSKGSAGKSFSRKRSRLLEETLAKFAQGTDDPARPPHKRPSTDTSACVPDSMLDMSNNTTITSLQSPNLPNNIIREHAVNSNPAAANSARFQVAMEFLQTEKNYVGILQTIINLFKKPLDDPNQAGGPILASEEVKAIFGSLPEIEAVHRSMNDDLQNAMMKWNDTTSIGDLVLKHAAGFVRCYPPFVNFFEESVDTISRCESRLPRFHAFLKINQSKKECGRQTLAELLINPVQRLPRIILLLQDVKKHTERENSSHPDIAAIATALESLKVVMTHINEDKRKTESQRHIFDIVYEVEGCPPTIVSSHRQFIARAELIAADDNLCKRGDHISVFIFSDCIEIAKRRRGAKSNSFKSPNVHARQSTKAKCMKHIKLMSLTHIKKMVNITDSEECQNAVAFYCRTPTDTQDWLYTFKILSCSDDSTTQSKQNSNELLTNNKENVLDDDRQKMSLLHLLAKYRASAFCKASDDNFVCVVSPCELDISTSDLGSTLGRAVRAAKKSSRKLTRAFSFSRTPRRVVQRAAVSTMLSPLTQKPLTRSDSNASVDMDVEDIPSSSSSLTPSLSVTSLCTPQRDRKAHRPASSCDDELMQFSQTPTLKSSVSTLTLARRPTEADMFDFPAIPTPPARRRKIGSTIKAATIALGRTGSFRRRNNKHETAV